MLTDKQVNTVISILMMGVKTDVVVHQEPSGKIIAYHSPLRGPEEMLQCGLCASGVRVYLNTGRR